MIVSSRAGISDVTGDFHFDGRGGLSIWILASFFVVAEFVHWSEFFFQWLELPRMRKNSVIISFSCSITQDQENVLHTEMYRVVF